MKSFFLVLILIQPLIAGETKDQDWAVGSFKPDLDKQAHFLAGYAIYSTVERATDKRFIQYGTLLMIAGAKETIDSWRSVGTLSDVIYSMAGAVVSDVLLTKLKLKTSSAFVFLGRNRIGIKVYL